ncbi:MAG: hypothetical protein N2322_05705, partial [Terrimicrobiaceae bacterium]|nr:hypothetical protein [Terrimicrobiaceae bacterium]
MKPTLADRSGHFGPYGGRFVPETLVSPLDDLAQEYMAACRDPEFRDAFHGVLREFCGRPTPLD